MQKHKPMFCTSKYTVNTKTQHCLYLPMSKYISTMSRLYNKQMYFVSYNILKKAMTSLNYLKMTSGTTLTRYDRYVLVIIYEHAETILQKAQKKAMQYDTHVDINILFKCLEIHGPAFPSTVISPSFLDHSLSGFFFIENESHG